MNYMTVQEAAQKWGVSERLVRRYCAQNRIPDLLQLDGIWQIPADTHKPIQKAKEIKPAPPLLQKLLRQRDKQRLNSLYMYLQTNMVYSNGRMASNPLTRTQIELLYTNDHISTNGKSLKVNDIIEARNHLLCVDMILDNAMKPLTRTLIQKMQALLLCETGRHKRYVPVSQGFRSKTAPSKFGATTPPVEIPTAINQLFKRYEAQKVIGLHEILDLHVQFERIRPFEDCNGRIGRLLMLKECLRHEVMPFVIDDKRRKAYYYGLQCWDENPGILTEVCTEAQARFEAQIALQKLMEAHARMTRKQRKEEHLK